MILQQEGGGCRLRAGWCGVLSCACPTKPPEAPPCSPAVPYRVKHSPGEGLSEGKERLLVRRRDRGHIWVGLLFLPQLLPFHLTLRSFEDSDVLREPSS